MPENITPEQQRAKHLAARAVVAYRLGIPVGVLSIAAEVEGASGIVWDWKEQRASLRDDAKLLRRAFASVYVGTIVDQSIRGSISDDLRKEVISDMSSALEVRQTAVDWGVVEALTDTDPFAHAGYKLASRLLKVDQELIDSLARELVSQTTIEGLALKKWLDANASSLNIDELEISTTY